MKKMKVNNRALPPGTHSGGQVLRLQKEIWNHLSPGGRDFFSEAFPDVLRAMVLNDDPTGLARGIDGMIGRTVLGVWARLEYRREGAPEADENAQAERIFYELDQVLLTISKKDAWTLIREEPNTTEHQLTMFHYSMAQYPVYSLVAARLHRGICTKIRQYQDLDDVVFRAYLHNFLHFLERIIQAFPAAQVRPSLQSYEPGEFESNIDKVIDSLGKVRRRTGESLQYCANTRKKYKSTWVAAFSEGENLGEFQTRQGYLRRKTALSSDQLIHPESIPTSHSERKRFIDQCNGREAKENLELGSRRKKGKGGSRRYIPTGKAPLLLEPSLCREGALDIKTIAYLHKLIAEPLPGIDEKNQASARLLIILMLYTGRHPDWLRIIVRSDPPASIAEASDPIFSSSTGRLYWKPLIHLGVPERLSLAFGNNHNQLDQTEWGYHQATYMPISFVHEIPLPPFITNEIFKVQKSFLSCKQGDRPNMAIANSPHLLQWWEKGQYRPMNDDDVKQIMASLTLALRTIIPNYSGLKTSNFLCTFDALFHVAGFSPVLRYALSERSKAWFEMPIRYSLVTSIHLDKSYGEACIQITRNIDQELMDMGESPFYRDLYDKDEWLKTITAQSVDKSYGSWHVPKVGIVSEVLQLLKHASFGKSGRAGQFSALEYRMVNVAVQLACICGLRDFEICRINWEDVDSGEIIVRGKRKPGLPFNRVIPLPPHIEKQLEIIRNKSCQEQDMCRKAVFQVKRQGRWGRAKPKDLNDIVHDVFPSQEFRPCPDLYAFRHRFRTDLLEAKFGPKIINYLMGHDISGYEIDSKYNSNVLPDFGKSLISHMEKMLILYLARGREVQSNTDGQMAA